METSATVTRIQANTEDGKGLKEGEIEEVNSICSNERNWEWMNN